MIKKSYQFLTGVLFFFILPASAFSGAITNGDFASGLSGWATVIGNGDVQASGGQAVLSTGRGTDPFSAVLVQGDDGNFNFPSPILISSNDIFFKFDALFADLGIDATESPLGSLTDHLNVWLYDANDLSGNHDALIANINASITGYSFDLSGFAGRSVAFSFELNDEADGRNTQVSIDNVRIEQRSIQPVPEPTSLALIIAGLFRLRSVRRSNRAA